MWMRKMGMLLCCFLLVFIVACSSAGGGTASEPEPEKVSTETGTEATNKDNEAAVEEEEATGTPEMDFDMGGRTLKWVSWYDESVKEDNPDSIEVKKNLDALMEKHNFKIEYVVVDFGEYQDKVTASLVAGEPLGDIIRVARPWMIPTLVKQDLFHPVDEYTKNEKVFIQQYTNEYSQFEGRGYGFRTGINGASSGVFYNRTLMNQLGMKPLQDYVNDDNWNWETFIQVAKEANKDSNNDGKLDIWGLATASILVQAMAANEANLVDGDKQNLEDPKTLEVLNFLSTLATESVARPTEGGDWTEPGQFFRQGNTLMVASSDYEIENFAKDMPDYDIGFLPFPKGPSATGYHSHNTIPNYLTVPSAIENPDQIVYIYEKMHEFESMYDYPKQSRFETMFSNEDDLNNARNAGESIKVIDTIDGYPSMPYYEFGGEILEGVSVSTVVEKYKEPFQAAIDEVWKK
ncbi:ABC transporter substrate-binding protein [Paenibacillus gallinarum]|uniref:Extracellular solute-binding protein n=1 Tax=Paenibacillus gallinarum TaxID=2762232 RepID=A0ABR8T160_9BACL|nr:extracellular solute-binding protein [Paenibacillus gallinarum]MBD7969497.1 extracellular solute-binding protein [Paenibacillus gallinarum]